MLIENHYLRATLISSCRPGESIGAKNINTYLGVVVKVLYSVDVVTSTVSFSFCFSQELWLTQKLRRGQEEVSWLLHFVPLHTSYHINEWEELRRGKRRGQNRGKAQEDFKNVWLPVETRRSQYRGTWTDQVGTQVSGCPTWTPATTCWVLPTPECCFHLITLQMWPWPWETLSSYPGSSTTKQGARSKHWSLSFHPLVLLAW